MRLSKMTVHGFKSFADKTVLHFDSGITCIVGPNGCGKSNIADAFRWVLGEQSAKSMRGSKMPDVIFAGASSRKPVHFAEVSLTLTDIDKALPIDYEEITITRRLHRSGESEYLINGNSVRLKDIHTLFLGSGIGKNAFSIFEQGKMDHIISATPEERRFIFEEAAGILRFLQRKGEANKKLELADINLSRLKDIAAEVTKQIQGLTEQASKAKKYKEQQNELKHIEKVNILLRLNQLEKQESDLLTKQKTVQNNSLTLKSTLSESEQHYVQLKSTKNHFEKEIKLIEQKLSQHSSEEEIQRREIISIEKRLVENRQRERKIQQELEDLILDKQARQKALAGLKEKQKEIDSKWSKAQTQWSDVEQTVKKNASKVAEIRHELNLVNSALRKNLQKSNEHQTQLKQVETKIDSLKEHKTQCTQRIFEIENERTLLQKESLEKKEALQNISEILEEHKDRLQDCEESIKIKAEQEIAAQGQMNTLRQCMMGLKTKQKMLLTLREEMEGFSNGSKYLLNESQKEKSPLYNKLKPLYEFFNPDKSQAAALSIILRSYTHTLVVKTAQDVQEVLEFALQANVNDFSLLCLEWLEDTSHALTRDSSVSMSRENRDLSAYVQKHFLQSIAFEIPSSELIHSLRSGICHGGWTENKTYIDSRLVLFKSKPNETSVFLRERELKEIEEEIETKENELTILSKAEKEIHLIKQELQTKRAEIDKLFRRDEMTLVEINFSLQRITRDIDKTDKEKQKSILDIAEIERQLEQQNELHLSLEKQSAEEQDVLMRLQKSEEDLEHMLKNEEALLQKCENDQKESASFYYEITENRQSLLHEQTLLTSKEADFENTKEKLEGEISDLKENERCLKEEKETGEIHLKTLAKSIIEEKEVLQQYLEKSKEIFQAVEKTENELQALKELQRGKENELLQIDIQLSHLKALSQVVIEELSEKYHLCKEEALREDISSPLSFEQSEKQIKQIRQNLTNMGDVNLTAIEELEKHQERKSFLEQQLFDVESSKKELLQLIEHLQNESKTLFKNTFDAIRANFRKNFQILFNGGEADIELTATEEILESGIEISAKPPGKQMRSISLLSGGEKCLTAVALLFAIFEVKPAPFCILDEIDAPLDDSNVERFLNVVKHFTHQCQFLIITHNKRTMAIGDVLFGVTMEEKGVSKLLSLEFDHKSHEEVVPIGSF